jgi:hypothetical protein
MTTREQGLRRIGALSAGVTAAAVLGSLGFSALARSGPAASTASSGSTASNGSTDSGTGSSSAGSTADDYGSSAGGATSSAGAPHATTSGS